MKKRVKLGLITALFALIGLISTALFYLPSSKSAERNQIEAILMSADMRPVKIEKSYLFAGHICAVDSIIPPTESNQIGSTKNTSLAIIGWIVTQSTGMSLPPMVFAILSGKKGVFWLEGKRVNRPDLTAAFDSHYFDQGGFEVIGNISNIPDGEFNLSIATGSEFVMGICVTDKVISIRK